MYFLFHQQDNVISVPDFPSVKPVQPINRVIVRDFRILLVSLRCVRSGCEVEGSVLMVVLLRRVESLDQASRDANIADYEEMTSRSLLRIIGDEDGG